MNDWDQEEYDRDIRRSEFVKHAAELFRKNGFKRTRLEDIVTIAKISKTALYYYFKNKKSIFIAVIDLECTLIYQEIEQHTLGAKLEDLPNLSIPIEDAFLRYVEKIVEIGDSFLHKNKHLFQDYNTFQSLISSLIFNFKEKNVALLKAMLNYGISHGDLSLTESEVELVAYAVFRICFTYFSDIMQGFDLGVNLAGLQGIVRLLLHPS